MAETGGISMSDLECAAFERAVTTVGDEAQRQRYNKICYDGRQNLVMPQISAEERAAFERALAKIETQPLPSNANGKAGKLVVVGTGLRGTQITLEALKYAERRDKEIEGGQ